MAMNPNQIRHAASETRATAESFSGSASPTVRALCEAAVFHASRAYDRAWHDPVFAAVHLELAEHAASGVLEAEDGGAEG